MIDPNLVVPPPSGPAQTMRKHRLSMAVVEHLPAMTTADEAMEKYLRGVGAGAFQNACLIFGMLVQLVQELHYFLPEVVARSTQFWCIDGDANETTNQNPNPCLQGSAGNDSNDSVPCTSWKFDSHDPVSIVTEWELVCDKKSVIDAMGSAYTVGAIVGIIMAPLLCEWLGRRTALLLYLLGLAAAGVALSAASSPTAFMVLRFNVALFATPMNLVSVILMSEIVASKDLAVYVMALELGNSAGSLALGWLSRSGLGWRFINLAAMAPVAFLFFQFGSTSESPRWLMRKREYGRAKRIMLNAARKNGIEPIRALNLWTKTYNMLDALDEQKVVYDTSHRLYCLLWATWRWTTAILLVTWFTTGFVTYTVVILYIRTTNRIFNFDVRGAMGPPTLVMAYMLVETLGRRRSVASALTTVGLMGSAVSILRTYFQATTTFFSLVGMSAIYVANAQLPLVTIEQYPSPLRAVSLSCALLAGQLGFLTAPFVSEQALVMGIYGPMFVASITSLTVGWLLVALPETKFENIAALKDKIAAERSHISESSDLTDKKAGPS